jgi:hypothetical protein
MGNGGSDEDRLLAENIAGAKTARKAQKLTLSVGYTKELLRYDAASRLQFPASALSQADFLKRQYGENLAKRLTAPDNLASIASKR